MTKTFCDFCGKERLTKKYILPFYFETFGYSVKNPHGATFNIRGDVERDVCSCCQNKIRQALAAINFKEDNE